MIGQMELLRFWKYVNLDGLCWTWDGKRDKDGYGVMSIGPETDRHQYRVHRLSYIIHHGPIPKGKIVMHTCDNPPCVTPDHVKLGTVADNNADRKCKGRSATGDRHPSHYMSWDHTRGENSANAVLTNGKVRGIRYLYRLAFPISEIAKIFKLSHGGASAVVHRRTWRHVC